MANDQRERGHYPAGARPAPPASASPREVAKMKKLPQQPRKPQKKRHEGRSMVLPVVFGILLAAVLSLLAYSVLSDPARSTTFFEGVHVAGVHIGGMTPEQAQSAVNEQQQQLLSDWGVNLSCEGQQWRIGGEDIALTMDLSEQLEAAWQVGRAGTFADRRRTISSLKREPYHTTGGVHYDKTALDAKLEAIRSQVNREPVDATAAFTPESEQAFAFTDEVAGKWLDMQAMREQIEPYILSLQNADVALVPQELTPNVTSADLQKNLTCIVIVTTNIHYTSTEGRNHNIRTALERLNNLMVTPGERVSFNKIIGRRDDPKNGYQEALEIAYGEYVPGIGGGVCQVSSTLYQAVLRAGLLIDTRSAHAIPSNYAERGQDATVSDNGADFVFRNNTDFPIYIRARFIEGGENGKSKKCEVAVYGRALPTGTRYVLESRQIGTDIEPEPEKEYIADKKKQYVTYTDEEKEVLAKRLGSKVEVYLVELRNDGMEVGRTLVSEDLYKPRPAQIYRGTTAR